MDTFGRMTLGQPASTRSAYVIWLDGEFLATSRVACTAPVIFLAGNTMASHAQCFGHKEFGA